MSGLLRIRTCAAADAAAGVKDPGDARFTSGTECVCQSCFFRSLWWSSSLLLVKVHVEGKMDDVEGGSLLCFITLLR